VKAHIGINGNELVDQLAKAATTTSGSVEYDSFPLSYAKKLIKQDVQQKWKQRYAEADTGRTTKQFFPSIEDTTIFTSTQSLSFEVTQILTGHGCFGSYLSWMKIKPSDACECDQRTAQTVSHVLEKCPRFAQERWLFQLKCLEFGVTNLSFPIILKTTPLIEEF
ncbi:unnamed protein product, partial [Ectocarpus sp. 12 AP-2014]